MDQQRQRFAAMRPGGIGEPLRTPLFRRIWLASLMSNFGLLIQAVGAAWAMTQLTIAADMVALVQTALMLPVMLVAIPAGAIADMYDRRKVALAALTVSVTSAALLTAMALAGMLTPWLLLLFCFLIGTGSALLGPAWQASVSEQVPPSSLPQAVALNSISYNIARSFGPALGGIIVATAGAAAAFGVNALFYVPLMVVLFLWRREAAASRLPPERIGRAIASGVRYIAHSPAIRIVLARTFATGFAGGSISALMPLVARDLVHGGAQTYGVLLGSFGIGAVVGALNIARIRSRFDAETGVFGSTLILAAAIALVAVGGHFAIAAIALFAAGAVWMIVVTLFNIGIQLSAPRWVAGRTLAGFQAAICGGIALGSWLWGHITEDYGVSIALLASAGTVAAAALLGRFMPMRALDEREKEPAEPLAEPQVALAVTGRSGPIVVEIEYRVDPGNARAFYRAMQEVERIRLRNGGYQWSIARDVADTALWTERFHCPTWHDYLRHRSRHTAAELAAQAQAMAFHIGPDPVRIRRMLERPFGSVRWREETPDSGDFALLPVAGGLGGA